MNPLNFSPGGKSPRGVLRKVSISGSPATAMDLEVSSSPPTDVLGLDDNVAVTFSR